MYLPAVPSLRLPTSASRESDSCFCAVGVWKDEGLEDERKASVIRGQQRRGKIWKEASSVWVMLRNSDFILISNWALRGVWYSFIFYTDHPGSSVGDGFSGARLEKELWPGGSIGWAPSHTPKGCGFGSSQGTYSGCGFHPQPGCAQETAFDVSSLICVLEWKSVEERSQNDSRFARSGLWDSMVGTWCIELEKQGDENVFFELSCDSFSESGASEGEWHYTLGVLINQISANWPELKSGPPPIFV